MRLVTVGGDGGDGGDVGAVGNSRAKTLICKVSLHGPPQKSRSVAGGVDDGVGVDGWWRRW